MHLVFDIGGTNMRLAVSKDGKTIDQVKIIPTPADFNQGIAEFKKIASELSKGEKIEVVAGGVAGPLDKELTTLISSPHIGGWVNQPIKEKLAEVFEAKVFLDNDCKMIALGEANMGAGKGKNIAAYLGIGTGVGGARVVNGRIDENSLGFEPGHQIIIPDGNICNCTGKGHLEAYIGGVYLARIYGQKGEEIKDGKIWDEIAKYLAIGLTNTIVHWSPDIVVLGGSVMKSIPLERVNFYLKEYLTIFPQGPEIALQTLGDDAGLYGALQYIQTH